MGTEKRFAYRLLEKLLIINKDVLEEGQLVRYATMLEVPGDITSDMTTFTKDPAPIERRRDELARVIAALYKL